MGELGFGMEWKRRVTEPLLDDLADRVAATIERAEYPDDAFAVLHAGLLQAWTEGVRATFVELLAQAIQAGHDPQLTLRIDDIDIEARLR